MDLKNGISGHLLIMFTREIKTLKKQASCVVQICERKIIRNDAYF